MPEDTRSEFLHGDIILINEPRNIDSAVSQTLAQARRKLSPADSICPWCRADEICLRLIVALAGFVWLGAASVLNEEDLAFYALSYVIAAMSVVTTPLTPVPASTQYRTEAYDSVDRGCSRDVKQHRLHSLASCILSPSSLLLLQQPRLNLRSFFRYYQFFISLRGQAGGVFEQEVNSCIRYYAAQGALFTDTLTRSGTHALLGLEPCRDTFTYFGRGVPWPNVFYQTYRDWKRWRLATLVCERIEAGENTFLPLSIVDGHDPLEGVKGRGDHKWFLVDPKLCSSRLR
ncbi:hypothetical protein F5883DRAFT_556385 [Diaporthe sp. PMI_573]|nr:hypothetical protein F5883DRAFT_556385 [Diaporthaceae sp. PMI_573]